MSKNESLIKEIDILRDDNRNYFIIFMTVISASFTAFYQVILGNVPLWILAIATTGLIVSLFVAILLKKNRHLINSKLKALEKE